MVIEVPPASPRSDNMRGSLLMIASMAGFSLNDAFIKSVGADLPLFQAVFLRGILASAFIGGLAWADGALRFRPGRSDGKLLGLRIFGEIGGTACFLTALFHMPLANATAILQSVPLAVTLAAALFLGETVGWRRYLAISVGFCGVLIIARPGAEGFNSYALWAAGAIFFIVLRDLSTRRMTAGAPALAVALITSLALTVVSGLASVMVDWQPVRPLHLGLLAISASGLLVGYVCGVNAMRLGDIGVTQPFRYTLLIFATVYGMVLFGEFPDFWTLVGSGIVVAAGLYTFHRERGA